MKLTSLEKCLVLIETLAAHPKGLTLSRLGELCGQPVSSIHHALSTLRERGYVTQAEDTKKYALGLKFLTISRAILDNMDIRAVALPELQKLYEQTREMVFLSVLRGRKVVYIDKLQPPGKLVLATEAGFALDAHTCTSGKLLLSQFSPEELRLLYPEERLPLHNDRTPPTRAALLREIAAIRAKGYCDADEQYYPGVRCVAAPVYSETRIVACVSVTGPMFSMTDERIASAILPPLLETSRSISRKL